MSNRATLALLAALVSIVPAVDLAAQEMPASERFVLVETEYRIEGFVLEAALDRLLGIEPGRVFGSIAELEDYRTEKERILRNERALDPDSSVGYELLDAGSGGAREARLVVRAATSWNALALPFPKYASGKGFSLALRYKDFNFLGTLEPMTLSLDWEVDDRKAEFGAEFELMPTFFGRPWIFDFAGDFNYRDEEPRFYDPNIAATFTTRYPWKALGLSLYAEPLVSYSYDSGDMEHVGQAGSAVGVVFDALLRWDLSSSLYYVVRKDEDVTHSIRNGMALETKIRLATIPFLGELSYVPSTELYVSTSIVDLAPNDLGWSLGQELATGRVDWRGNFRQGASASVANAYTYHFIHDPDDPSGHYDLETALDIEAYGSIGGLVGFNSRVVGRWFGDWTFLEDPDSYDWDALLRGYRPKLRGDLGLVANLELALNTAQGRFFGLDLFESEVFIDLFVDLGFVRHDPAEPLNPRVAEEIPLTDPGNFIMCGGLEFIVYPLRARSFAYRLSMGYDLGDFYKTKDFDSSVLEISLGLGTHF